MRCARAAIKAVPDSQLGDAVKFFGQDSNKGNVLMLYATHAHEHLGQAIAYARTVGVVPPWSAKSATQSTTRMSTTTTSPR